MADELEIGPAGPDDKEWAAALMAGSEPWLTLRWGLEACRAACFNPQCEVFVARRGGERLGFVRLHRSGVAGSPYLASIAVAEGARGAGVGRRLLDFTEDHFRPVSPHLFLCVSSFNPRARALYERQGYEAVGVLKDYVVEGADEILMHRWLRRR